MQPCAVVTTTLPGCALPQEYQLAVEGFARAGELDPSLPWRVGARLRWASLALPAARDSSADVSTDCLQPAPIRSRLALGEKRCAM